MKIDMLGSSFELVGHVPLSAPKDQDGGRTKNASIRARFAHGVLPVKVRSLAPVAGSSPRLRADLPGKAGGADGAINRKETAGDVPQIPALKPQSPFQPWGKQAVDAPEPTAALPDVATYQASRQAAPMAAKRVRFAADAGQAEGVDKAHKAAITPPNQYDIHDEGHLRIRDDSMLLIGFMNREGPAKAAIGPLNEHEAHEMQLFIRHVAKTMHISQQHMLIAQHYMARLPQAAWQQMPRVGVVAGCLLLAKKYRDDRVPRPQEWSAATRIPTVHLFDIELKLMKHLDYRLSVGDVGPARERNSR